MSNTRGWSCVVVGVVCACPGPALAQATAAAPPAKDEGYGWQTLAVEGFTIAIAATLAGTDARDDFDGPPSRGGTFAGSYWMLSTVSVPAVHFAHHNPVGWASLGMRLLVPPLASAIGALSTCMGNVEEDGGGFEDGCENSGFTGGMIVGTAGVALFDTFLLAKATSWEKPAVPQRWYGWQTLLVDAGAIGIGAWISSNRELNDEGELPSHTIGLGAGMYAFGFLGAPFVHVGHGRPLRALGDFALRGLGVPVMILPGVIGWCAATAGAGDGSCAETGVEIGLVGGSVAAALIDAFVLGWEDEELPPGETPTGPPGMVWFPSFELRTGGGALTLNASF